MTTAVLCLIGAAAATVALPLPADGGFGLRWTHSVERVEWREQWAATPTGTLRLVESRVRGSGAGMEPPDGARLVDGWYIHRPARHTAPEVPALRLAGSPHAAPYTLCVADRCRSLDALLGDDTPPGPVTLAIAPDPADCPPRTR